MGKKEWSGAVCPRDRGVRGLGFVEPPLRKTTGGEAECGGRNGQPGEADGIGLGLGVSKGTAELAVPQEHGGRIVGGGRLQPSYGGWVVRHCIEHARDLPEHLARAGMGAIVPVTAPVVGDVPHQGPKPPLEF